MANDDQSCFEILVVVADNLVGLESANLAWLAAVALDENVVVELQNVELHGFGSDG